MKTSTIIKALSGAAMFAVMGLVQVSSATAPMFTQCASDPGTDNTSVSGGCNILITVNPDGSLAVQVDPLAGGFGGEDQYVGIVNNSSKALTSVVLSANTDIFGFDQDGTFGISARCAMIDPTGVNGCDYAPNDGSITFTNFSNALMTGQVNFIGGLASGATTAFELEDTIQSSGSITVGPGNPTGVPEPESIALLGLGIVAMTAARKRFVRR